MPAPLPTPIYRLLHIDNLPMILRCGGLHAPNFSPAGELPYRTIHSEEVQASRRVRHLPCGPRGSAHDYVPFYFGVLSVMLLNLKTNRVPDYTEGQQPLIYLVSSAQAVAESGAGFVFSDGHGLARFTSWYDALSHLGEVDWQLVSQRYWADNSEDNDRQRRKQAEFLVHRFCAWSLIQQIGVLNSRVRDQVVSCMNDFPGMHRPEVHIRPEWYY